MSAVRFLLLVAAVSTLWVGVSPDSVGADSSEPRIEVIAPNPVTEGNRGEYVVLSIPEPTDLRGWTLSDGTQTAVLPNRTVSGTIAFSNAPSVAELLTTRPVLGWSGHLPLAADGERLTLRDPSGRVVDEVRYPRTANGDRWIRIDGDMVRDRPGRTNLHFPSHEVTNVTAFVLPDASEVPSRTLARAEDRLLLAGYQLTDPAIRNVLLDRHAAGVDVRVLVDGDPVGGQSAAEVATLDDLTDAGIPVRVLTGARDRYRFHHPKYAVVDDTIIVMTENWKPAGTGGASSRGWGVVVSDPAVAGNLETVFEVDFRWRDTIAWERRRATVTARHAPPRNGSYPTSFAPSTVPVEGVRVVVGPDETEDAITAVIQNATHSIDVQQVRISDANFPLLAALLEAARRGVRVRIHVDRSWYVADENAALAEALHARATAEELPVEVRLADPGMRYEKVHTKGLIVDETVVVLGSMNWNNVSMRENREIVVILEGAAVGAYYTATFEEDWMPAGGRLPVGLVGAVAFAWSVAAVIARHRVRFAG